MIEPNDITIDIALITILILLESKYNMAILLQPLTFAPLCVRIALQRGCKSIIYEIFRIVKRFYEIFRILFLEYLFMRECSNCHKRGLFLKLTNGLCKNCFNLNLPSITVNDISIQGVKDSRNNLENNFSIQNFDNFIFHEDIKDLIWFCDGRLKNCDIEEPSAISNQLLIEECQATDYPDYYPSYHSLTPKQRYIYLRTLENPYIDVNIGYIFILYYGLERHLISGKFDEAFNVILKLRSVHKNTSFQNYSFTALVTAALIKNRTDLCELLLKQESNECSLHINNFILYKILTKKAILPSELMKYARSFGYTNTYYIKDYPTLFEQYLSDNLNKHPIMPYKDIDLKKVHKFSHCFFANMSFFSNTMQFSDYLSYSPFSTKCLDILHLTHEQVKNELKTNRNNYTKQEHTPAKKIIYNNPDFYPSIDEYNHAVELFKSTSNCPSTETLYSIHFQLSDLITKIYKYREHPLALQHVIDLCQKDISIFQSYNSQLDLVGAHVESYYKLCNIYEKQGKFDEAIRICKDAISKQFAIHHDETYFRKKYEKLKEKKHKQGET